jgi:hypothetical protein
VAVVSATSFDLRVTLLLDLEGFFVSVSAATTTTMVTVRGRQHGIGGRGG